MITLRQLRYLTALEAHRRFGRAADACAVTQPALSMQIRELERELGVEARALARVGEEREADRRVRHALQHRLGGRARLHGLAARERFFAGIVDVPGRNRTTA